MATAVKEIDGLSRNEGNVAGGHLGLIFRYACSQLPLDSLELNVCFNERWVAPLTFDVTLLGTNADCVMCTITCAVIQLPAVGTRHVTNPYIPLAVCMRHFG